MGKVTVTLQEKGNSEGTVGFLRAQWFSEGALLSEGLGPGQSSSLLVSAQGVLPPSPAHPALTFLLTQQFVGWCGKAIQ